MKTSRYESTSRSVRTLAAVAAVATVVALFDFVAGLGDTDAGALAGSTAAFVAKVASAASHAPSASLMQ